MGTGNGTRMKSGSKKNQSLSINPNERESTHKVKTFLDETSQQFIGVGGAPKAHSLTRSNRDY